MTISNVTRNVISHYGILGMRWGRRKNDSGGHQDHVRAKTLRKKRVSEMSNEELKELVIRMNLERQLRDVKASDVSRGKKITMEILEGSAKQLGQEAITKSVKLGAGELVKVVIKKK